jgi:hypothetical protein
MWRELARLITLFGSPSPSDWHVTPTEQAMPAQNALEIDQLALAEGQVVDEIPCRGTACGMAERDFIFADALAAERMVLQG